ncbi:LysR family transcriptional regulator [Aquabacterium sp. J223]|uniref:LysR family transcriptional regulator n=1 Tax=Aquabacterium sp. J223 TaxID=2898431 RepID=UPI0021AD5442|nr:LysR family transcriptional regulator [Aquabacterium sp. J223]UUX95137.1 LysR family transcriptional regulator [Aquabacterium sp. J223]
MSLHFNYRHLYYFWVVAKEGGIGRAAARLGLAVQTLSAQVRTLERDLGHALLKPEGRRVVLTDAGQAALQQAEAIFQLGSALPQAVRDAGRAPVLRLACGISDGLSKLAVHRLLAPALSHSGLRLTCHDDEFDDLLADLALHRLDVVLADRPAPSNPSLRVYSHRLGQAAIAWYAPPAVAAKARRRFPRSLGDWPVLLPTDHASVRRRLTRWFEQQDLRPQIAGEFEDSALLATFAARGMGLMPAADWAHDDLVAQGLRRIGGTPEVEEQYYAICSERKVQHPLVLAVLHGPGKG